MLYPTSVLSFSTSSSLNSRVVFLTLPSLSLLSLPPVDPLSSPAQVCAIVGGTFTVAGIIDSAIFTASEMFKKFELGKLT